MISTNIDAIHVKAKSTSKAYSQLMGSAIPNNDALLPSVATVKLCSRMPPPLIGFTPCPGLISGYLLIVQIGLLAVSILDVVVSSSDAAVSGLRPWFVKLLQSANMSVKS